MAQLKVEYRDLLEKKWRITVPIRIGFAFQTPRTFTDGTVTVHDQDEKPKEIYDFSIAQDR